MQTRKEIHGFTIQKICVLKFFLSSEANLYRLGTSYHEIFNGNLANVFPTKFSFRKIFGR